MFTDDVIEPFKINAILGKRPLGNGQFSNTCVWQIYMIRVKVVRKKRKFTCTPSLPIDNFFKTLENY